MHPELILFFRPQTVSETMLQTKVSLKLHVSWFASCLRNNAEKRYMNGFNTEPTGCNGESSTKYTEHTTQCVDSVDI